MIGVCRLEIPAKVKNQLDATYESPDNMDFIIDYKGEYLPKKGNVFAIRHYHHIDQNRSNNELWNLIPLSDQDHIIEIHTKNNKDVKEKIYEYMVEQYPEHIDHYKRYLKD